MIIDDKEAKTVMNEDPSHGDIDVVMHHIDGKWKTVVLWHLRKEPKQFNELKRLIPEITEDMLFLQLESLEKDEIVEKKVYAEIPPRVEYFLTAEGKTRKLDSSLTT